MTNEIKNAYWNGEPANARFVKVIVGKALRPTWWCAGLEGQEHCAIEVELNGEKFYLNDDHQSFQKITAGKGCPSYGHKSLPVERVIEETT